MILLITISLLYSSKSFSQGVDTASLRKDIEKILKKHGLKDNPYQFIISENQSGGQNAYIITNNYAPNSRVVHGDNLGINGDVRIETTPHDRHLTEDDFNLIVSKKDKSKTIRVHYCSKTTEATRYAEEIVETLRHYGYTVSVMSSSMNNIVEDKRKRFMIKDDNGIYIHCR